MSKLVINFYANVSEAAVRDLIGWTMQQIAGQNPEEPITELIINLSSSGGSSDHGLLAYNFLRQLSIPKTIIGMGNVDSAAVLIFAAGDKRLAATSCRFVLHEARATIHGEFNSTKLAEMANLTKRITEDYVNVIALVTGKGKKVIVPKVRNGTVLSCEDAININLVTSKQDEPYLASMKDLAILMIANPQVSPPSMAPQQENQVTT